MHTPTAPSPVLPFDPYRDLVKAALKKDDILKLLEQEKAKPKPNPLVIEAFEIWLRVYHRETQRRAAYDKHTKKTAAGDA
jgi:hypothetical protein